MRQALSTSPTALAGLTASTRYTVQNRSHRVVYLQVASAAPADTAAAFAIKPDGFAIVSATGSDNVYVWASAAGGAVVYDEAA